MRRVDFAALPDIFTFTVDVEDHLPAAVGSRRFIAMTERLLDFLEEHKGRGTFFVVGEIAERAPELVREIAARGHEVACHGHRHVSLARLEPNGFRREIAASRALLEDLAGVAVRGFRAPRFSLDARTAWAVDCLAAAGFTYSSSVLPVLLPGLGFARAPTRPFWWPGRALLEIPCPVGSIGPFRAPCLGGLYLRYLPQWRLVQLLHSLETDVIWTYCHPYDVDTEEPFTRVRDGDPLTSFLLWWQRGRLVARLRDLMAGRTSLTFAERLAELRGRAVTLTLPLGATGSM